MIFFYLGNLKKYSFLQFLTRFYAKYPNRYWITSRQVNLELNLNYFLDIPEIKRDYTEWIYENVMSKKIFDTLMANTKLIYSVTSKLDAIKKNLNNIKSKLVFILF